MHEPDPLPNELRNDEHIFRIHYWRPICESYDYKLNWNTYFCCSFCDCLVIVSIKLGEIFKMAINGDYNVSIHLDSKEAKIEQGLELG